MATRNYTIDITNHDKLIIELGKLSFGNKVTGVQFKPDEMPGVCIVNLTEDLVGAEITEFNDFFSTWSNYTTAETLKMYLDESVFPFIDNLILKFASENIAMGITYYGKTAEMLGLFENKVDVESNGFPISLKGTFDTGSLKESLVIIQHYRNNPATTFEQLGLHTNGYVTDTRLLAMMNEIEVFLGITPLST